MGATMMALQGRLRNAQPHELSVHLATGPGAREPERRKVRSRCDAKAAPVTTRTGSVLALILLVAPAGCTKVGTTGVGSRHSYTIPHVLRYATGEDVAGLNTHLYNSAITVGFMSALTAAWLTKTGPHNEPVPELATVIPSKENGGVSSDGKTITWHLRKGVVWSDGAPFNADNVVFSTKAVLDPANNELSRDGWDLITKIDEPDKYTVVYHLKHPYGDFAYLYFSSAGTPSVLPRHLLAGLPNINHAAYNALPVGIGPFKYAQWKRSDFVEMVANRAIFGAGQNSSESSLRSSPTPTPFLANYKVTNSTCGLSRPHTIGALAPFRACPRSATRGTTMPTWISTCPTPYSRSWPCGRLSVSRSTAPS